MGSESGRRKARATRHAYSAHHTWSARIGSAENQSCSFESETQRWAEERAAAAGQTPPRCTVMVGRCAAPPVAGTAGDNWPAGRSGVVDTVVAGAGRSPFCRQQQRQPVLQSQFAGRLEPATSPQQR